MGELLHFPSQVKPRVETFPSRRRPSRLTTAGRAAVAGGAVVGTVAIGTAINRGVEAYHKHQADQEASRWQQTARRILEDPTLPSSKDYYARVVVVASGRNLEERQKMQQEQTRVNVRVAPELNDANGTKTKEIGQVDQGVEIDDGTLVEGTAPLSPNKETWFAAFCRNIRGLIYKNGRSNTPAENTVCFIDANYVQKTK